MKVLDNDDSLEAGLMQYELCLKESKGLHQMMMVAIRSRALEYHGQFVFSPPLVIPLSGGPQCFQECFLPMEGFNMSFHLGAPKL